MAGGGYSTGYSTGYATGAPTVPAGEDGVWQIVPDALHTFDRLDGYAITEDSSAAAVVELRAGSATGTIVVGPIHLAADETTMLPRHDTQRHEFPGGVWVKEVSGSIAGQLWERR